jgi:hypothetical protein
MPDTDDMSMLMVYEIYGPAEIKNMKQQFVNHLNDVARAEKKMCKKRTVAGFKTEPQMLGDNRKAVMKLLEECKTPWQIEALRRLVIFFNQIPDMHRVTLYADALKTEVRKQMKFVPKDKHHRVIVPMGNA